MPPKYASKCLYSTHTTPTCSWCSSQAPKYRLPSSSQPWGRDRPRTQTCAGSDHPARPGKQEGTISMFFAHDHHPPCVCHNSRQVQCHHWNRRTVGSPGHSQVHTPGTESLEDRGWEDRRSDLSTPHTRTRPCSRPSSPPPGCRPHSRPPPGTSPWCRPPACRTPRTEQESGAGGTEVRSIEGRGSG